MFKLRTASRLALTFGLITAALAWSAISLDLISNPDSIELENRVGLTKSIALSVTAQSEGNRKFDLATYVDRIGLTNDSIESISVQRLNRRTPEAIFGAHEQLWVTGEQQEPTQHVCVDVMRNGRMWGQLQIVFSPLSQKSWLGFPFGLIGFIGASTTLTSWWVMNKTFRYLNPANVVPGRVRSALDTLAEGLVLIDPNGEVAHANQAFASIVGIDPGEIIGRKLDDFGWLCMASDGGQQTLPWHRCRESSQRVCGEIVELETGIGDGRKFVVNATPIVGEKNSAQRGVLASFDDVTELESKNTELASMIDTLRKSRDEISKQNEKLNFLASYDPLTKCMNRRAFFGQFETLWTSASENGLALIMLDVDNFKAVNDNHGHSVGDEVLKATGNLLREFVGTRGLVCRYGGEEFIVLIPDLEFDQCVQLTEKLRATIESTPAGGISFTASFGISSHAFGSMDPQHMLDQADECLYVAKRHGRNQVVRFDEIQNYKDSDKETEQADRAPRDKSIAYSAVTGLLSALSFRCRDTAQHSIRVADLCVAVGDKMMKKSDLYLLEVSALLHDIGKIGVPDSILHKPGPLTPEEWEVMQKHDAIGVEIVKSAFASQAITDAIASHHYCFKIRNNSCGQVAAEEQIPLAGRIITVCDAFDAMTNDRVYRKAMSKVDAVEELARNSPSQFDPEVVASLVEHIQTGVFKQDSTVGLPRVGRGSAAAIGKYIELLQNAVAAEDVELLKEVVEELKQEPPSSSQFESVTGQLDDAINSQDGDIERVLNLANEVMEICRSSRGAFVDAAEEIFKSPSP